MEIQREQLRAEAAEKIVRARMIGIEPEQDATLTAWRRRAGANEAAYWEVLGVWDAAAELSKHSEFPNLIGRPTWRERVTSLGLRLRGPIAHSFRPQRLAFASCAAALLAAGGWLVLERPWAPDFQTGIAEVQQLALDDGSSVTLGAKSTLNVTFKGRVRRVRLAEGEAFFSVARDANRPFVVLAGETLVHVVGTKFNVNYEGSRVRVTVLEGVVEVMRSRGVAGGEPTMDPAQRRVLIRAGQQALDARSLPGPQVESAQVSDPGAWRAGWLSYQDTALAEILADANRYRAAPIRIASPALARERLTTSFKTSEIDQMLEQLPDTLPVQVRYNPDGSVDLTRM